MEHGNGFTSMATCIGRKTIDEAVKMDLSRNGICRENQSCEERMNWDENKGNGFKT